MLVEMMKRVLKRLDTHNIAYDGFALLYREKDCFPIVGQEIARLDNLSNNWHSNTELLGIQYHSSDFNVAVCQRKIMNFLPVTSLWASMQAFHEVIQGRGELIPY